MVYRFDSLTDEVSCSILLSLTDAAVLELTQADESVGDGGMEAC
jgi:hypothetical protein